MRITVLYCCVQVVLVFYIAIWDVNDNAPVFINPPYVVNISEVKCVVLKLNFNHDIGKTS